MMPPTHSSTFVVVSMAADYAARDPRSNQAAFHQIKPPTSATTATPPAT